MKKRNLAIWCLVALMLIPAWGFAANNDNPAPPLQDIEQATPSNWQLDMPVWKQSTIDQISKTALSAGDISYTLTPTTRYCTESGTALTPMNFHKGTTVKLVLAADRHTVLTLVKVR